MHNKIVRISKIYTTANYNKFEYMWLTIHKYICVYIRATKKNAIFAIKSELNTRSSLIKVTIKVYKIGYCSETEQSV